MTKKRKASLGLGALEKDTDQSQTGVSLPEAEASAPPKITPEKVQDQSKPKKKVIPIYVEPALHEALHTLVFSERHKKTSFQTLFIEGLDLALKERGLPSVEELSSGEKTLNL